MPASRPGRNGFPLLQGDAELMLCSAQLVLSEGSEMPLISSHSVIPTTLMSSLYKFLFVDLFKEKSFCPVFYPGS